MSTDPNIYELIVRGTDSRSQPQIITVEGTNPDELIRAAREMSEVTPGGPNGAPTEVMAVVNGLPIAKFMGRWMWDNHNPIYRADNEYSVNLDTE